MRTATGIINQYIEIYSDQDYDNNSGGVIPNSAIYWATTAEVKTISAKRDLAQAQEQFKPAFTFTISDRNDKNVKANMLLKWRGSWFTITSCEPDYVYVQMLKITAITSDPPAREATTEYALDWFYSDIDYHGNEENIPEFQFSKNISLTAPSVQMDLTMASSGKFIGFRMPGGFADTFTQFKINEFNQGTIPGFNWYSKVTIDDQDYYLSRTEIFLSPETTNLTVL